MLRHYNEKGLTLGSVSYSDDGYGLPKWGAAVLRPYRAL